MNIYFKTSPMFDLLVPRGDAAEMSLLVTGADGRPLEGGSVALRLDAPKPGALFSTDVPLVEGTLLSEMRLPLRRGRVSWKYQFPIRGEYRLGVEIVSADRTQATKIFRFTVRENHRKWLTLGVFSLGLLLLGFIAGRVFTGLRTTPLLLMVALAAAMVCPVAATAVTAADVGAARLEIAPPTVGKPSLVHWRLVGGAGDGQALTALTLTITQLEENKIVFALQRVAVAGEFVLNFHFTDGSEHRVTAVAELPGRAPIKNEKIISVTAPEPPMSAMIPALVLFLAVIVLGLALGRFSK